MRVVNEYGEPLDSNGYAPSILQHENHCFICYRNMYAQRHEIFHGSNRQKSKEYGLWINVCPVCHNSIHFTDGELDQRLKERGQDAAMAYYGWSTKDFIARFGRNYL